MKEKHKIECNVCHHAVSILAELCAANPDKIIDLLTDYLWDKEEAEMIKHPRKENHGD